MQEQLLTYQTPVLPDWIDYNGHLRDAFYFLIFSYATDSFMAYIGLDEQGRASTQTTLYTLEAHINYLAEAKLNDMVEVRTQLIEHDAKRLHIMHSLYRMGTTQIHAVSEQLLINIDKRTGRSGAFAPSIEVQVAKLFTLHKELERPALCGSRVSIRR